MTPPRPETDQTRPWNGDRTPVMSPAEISQVTEASRALVDMILPAVRDEMERRFQAQTAKAEETSAALIKLPRKVQAWQLIAAVAAALGVGGTGGSLFSGNARAGQAEERATSAEVKAADAETAAQAAVVAATQPRQEPADLGRLADALDRLDRRLGSLEARMERLEDRRGR